MIVHIAPLSEADSQAIEALLDAAFGADRQTRTAYRLREGTAPISGLSFAAFAGNTLVGSLQSWPVALDEIPLILVGPVAVSPERQRAGVGHLLMKRLLAAAPDAPMAMIGDPEYYDRFFGFTAAATGGWQVPGPVERHRLLARNAQTLPRTGMLRPRAFAASAA